MLCKVVLQLEEAVTALLVWTLSQIILSNPYISILISIAISFSTTLYFNSTLICIANS